VSAGIDKKLRLATSSKELHPVGSKRSWA